MNHSPWGRQRNNLPIKDLQTLAFWLVLIGVGGYLLFPNFFQDLYNRFQLTGTTATQITQPQTSTDTQVQPSTPTVFQEVYGSSDQPQELSKGYWVVFVQDGSLQQIALTEESYGFISGLIAKDKSGGTQKLILAANGQVRQVLVSEELFNIVSQLNIIGGRNRSP